MRRDAGEEGGCDFSSKMPRIMSNLPDFPRRPFLYAHLCVYTKSMDMPSSAKSMSDDHADPIFTDLFLNLIDK